MTCIKHCLESFRGPPGPPGPQGKEGPPSENTRIVVPISSYYDIYISRTMERSYIDTLGFGSSAGGEALENGNLPGGWPIAWTVPFKCNLVQVNAQLTLTQNSGIQKEYVEAVFWIESNTNINHYQEIGSFRLNPIVTSTSEGGDIFRVSKKFNLTIEANKKLVLGFRLSGMQEIVDPQEEIIIQGFIQGSYVLVPI